MKALLPCFYSVLLVQPVALTTFKHGPRYQRSKGQINYGCEMTYNVESVFKYCVLVYYTQRIASASFGDIARLVTRLSSFSSKCCFTGAGAECFQDKNRMFLDQVCEDVVLKIKNQDVSMCCDMSGTQREACFEDLRHRPSGHLPALYGSNNLHERCLHYMNNPQDFIESLLYDISRRMRLFPSPMIAKIVKTSLKSYSTCCKEPNLKTCFATMEAQTVQTIASIIEQANEVCNEYKDMGAEKSRLWGIMFYASLQPKSVIGSAVEFALTYEKYAARCCDFNEWTSDCFLGKSEVLLNLFCAKSSTEARGGCCLESGPERARCLHQNAIRESEDVPEKIPLGTENLCQMYMLHNARLFLWFTFEYSRRHTEQNLNSVRNAASDFRAVLRRCCEEDSSQTCLSASLSGLPFSVISKTAPQSG